MLLIGALKNGKKMRHGFWRMILGGELPGGESGNTMMMYVPDYNLEPPPPPKYPTCPMCGTELYDYLVEDVTGDIVGCSECTKTYTAEEYMEVLADEER